MIFKTITDESTLSGQRIVSALQARKIVQQQATAQLEIDIACLKQYEIACQSGSVSTDQFDNIMKKASVTAKEYTANIKAGTGTAQSYAQAQKANNVVLQSVGTGAGIASKAVKVLSATMNTLAITAIFSLISKSISWITEQINNYIHRNEIAIEKAEELLNTFKSEVETITSNQDKINGYADEFKELSEGVDDLGRNVSLTADEYSRYQNIVKEIVGINPSLISGYDEENNILADKNGLIETSIQLLKDEYNQKLKNLALPDNVDTAINGAIGRYNSAKEDFLEVEIPTSLAFSGVKIDENGNRETGYVNQISKYIEDVIGVEFTGWEGGINQYILDNAEAVFDNLDKIKERAAQTKDGWEGLNDSQLIDLMDYFKELRIAYNDMNNATTSANPTLQYVAMAEDSYLELSDIQKKFVADYINGIHITSDTTEQEKDNIRKSIISLVQELSSLDNDEINKALANLYAIPADEQSINEYIEQFKNALEIIKSYCEENGIEIPIAIIDSEKGINDLETQYQRAVEDTKAKFDGYDPTAFFKENSINTQEEIDKWLKIAQAANNAAEAENKYAGSQKTNLSTLFSDSDNNAIDLYQNRLAAIQEALENLRDGELKTADVTDLIQELMSEDMGFELTAEQVNMATSSFDGLKETLLSLSDTALEELLEQIGELSNYEDPKAVAEWVEAFKDMQKEAVKAAESLDSVNNAITGINSVTDALDNLKSAYQSVESGEGITFDDLVSLQEAFGDLDAFAGLAQALTDNSSLTDEVQQAFDALITEFLNNEDRLQDLWSYVDADNAGFYKQWLSNMGINVSEGDLLDAVEQSGILNDYSSEQIKINNNIITYTDDYWQTAKCALGKIQYYNPILKTNVSQYGLIADAVISGILMGNDIIGGAIYSMNFSDDAGTYIDLVNGDFSFAGRKLQYVSETNSLNLTGKIIFEDIDYSDGNAKSLVKNSLGITATENSIATIENDIINSNSTIEKLKKCLGFTTEISSDYVISPYIGGGYLQIENTSYGTVIIDPSNIKKTGYIFGIYNSSKSLVAGVNTNGNGILKGSIITDSGLIGGFTIGNSAIYNGTNSLTSTSSGIYLGIDGIRQYASSSAYVNISNGILTAKGANISGTITTSNITATGGKIGGFNIGSSAIYNGTNSMSSTTSGVYLGTSGIRVYSSSSAYVNISGGVLTSVGANISGAITTSNITATGGTIGGISIGNGLYYSGTSSTDGFGFWKNGQHPSNGSCVIMHAGANNTNIGGAPFRVYQNGDLYCNNANISNANITGGTFSIGSSFNVSSSGILTAKGANIGGTITTDNINATGGKIGDWTIDPTFGCLYGSGGVNAIRLFPKGVSLSGYTYYLVIYDSGGSVPIGGLTSGGWRTVS